MHRSLSAGRIIVVALVMVVGGSGAPGPLATARDAGAALVCQHARKPRAFLRVDACRKKETAVFDTAADGARLDALARVVGSTCPADPTRRLLTPDADVAGLMSLGYVGGSLCRTLDDDLAACAESYETTSYYGATACAPVKNKCMPCYQPLDVLGICRNVCQPPVACTADPGRTSVQLECAAVTTPAACAQSWTTTVEYATPTDIVRSTSCFWDATAMPAVCRKCSPEDTSRGRCANSCIAATDMPRCRVGGRTYGRCAVLDGDPVGCAMTYETSIFGTATCWYDAGTADCSICDPLNEAQGRCTNGC